MDHIMNKIQAEYGYSDYQIKLIKFSLTGILYDVSKTLIFLVFFCATGKGLEYLFAIVPLILLRTRTGGIHFRSYWSCLLASFVYLYAVINILPVFVTVHPLIVYLVLLVCAVLDYLIGPATLKERPKAPENAIKKAKIQNFQVVFLVAVAFFIFSNHQYLMVSFWTVVFHTVQLFITKWLKEVKYHEELA